jgi:hypothetical protein
VDLYFFYYLLIGWTITFITSNSCLYLALDYLPFFISLSFYYFHYYL